MKLFDFNAFILNETLILEGRIENLEAKYKDKIDEDAIKWLKDEDPTPNKAYFEWALKTYSNLDEVEKENLEKLKIPIYKTFSKIIRNFHNSRMKLSPEEKDINSYRRISQLYSKIMENEKDYSKSEIESYGEVEIHANNDEWLIFTPKEFGVAQEYGHNDRGGKNWCVCYDEDYFYEYFCPDDGITMIINKLDYTKDIALQKENDGDITVWDEQDSAALRFTINEQDRFINWLEKEGDYEFVKQYFIDNPIEQSDLPDVTHDDLVQNWIDSYGGDWYDYVDTYSVSDYIDMGGFRRMVYSDLEHNERENPKWIEGDHMFNYLSDTGIIEDLGLSDEELEDLESADQQTLLELIMNHGDWNSYYSNWFDDYVDDSFLEELIGDDYDISDLEDYIDTEQVMKDQADNMDETELAKCYYGHW